MLPRRCRRDAAKPPPRTSTCSCQRRADEADDGVPTHEAPSLRTIDLAIAPAADSPGHAADVLDFSTISLRGRSNSQKGEMRRRAATEF